MFDGGGGVGIAGGRAGRCAQAIGGLQCCGYVTLPERDGESADVDRRLPTGGPRHMAVISSNTASPCSSKAIV